MKLIMSLRCLWCCSYFFLDLSLNKNNEIEFVQFRKNKDLPKGTTDNTYDKECRYFGQT